MFNINNNLYKQTTARAHAYASENLKKENNDGDELVARIKKISALDPAIAQRTLILVEQLQNDEEKIKISGKRTARAEILRAYNQMLGQSDALERLQFAYHEVDTTPGVRNPYKYTVALLYNVATNSPKPEYTKEKSPREGMMTHNYTKEQLDSLWTNFDEIELS